MSARTSLLAFVGVAALTASTLAFAPAVLQGDDSRDGKARAADAGLMDGADRVRPLGLSGLTDLGIVDCVAGAAGPFLCDNVDLVDVVPTAAFGGAHGSDSWGWTDDGGTPADSEDDTDYVIVTSGNGIGFFRLGQDGTAGYLGTLARSDTADRILWNDPKVVNDHAYITSEDDAYGVQVVDMTRIAELEVQDPIAGQVTIEADNVINDGLGGGHNMVAWEEIGVVGIVLGEDADCGGQLVLFDVNETPADPQRLGCVDPGLPGIGNVPLDENGNPNPLAAARVAPHDAHCVVYRGPDADYNGAGGDGVLGNEDDVAPSHICALFSQESGGLILVDVSDITRDRTVALADGGKGGQVINRFTYDTMHYAHQGWFTEGHEFVLFNDELDESGAAALGLGGGDPLTSNAQTTTYWVDVSDLDVGIKQTDPAAIYGPNPILPTDFRVNEDLVQKWSNPSTLAIDHNMYPVGNFLYQANYGAGLRVLEFSAESLRGPAADAFEEVAYFDTYPGPGPSEFYGAWNVYPFFGDDRVILSDFQAGLLVLDVHDEVFED